MPLKVTSVSARRRGRCAASTPASCFLPEAVDSCFKYSPSASSVMLGSRSNSKLRSSGRAWPLTTRLRSSITGPDKPKCANSSEPRREARRVVSSRKVAAASGMVMPRSSATTRAVCMTNDGSFTFCLRTGSGERYGASVSTRIRSLGVNFTTSRSSSVFL